MGIQENFNSLSTVSYFLTGKRKFLKMHQHGFKYYKKVQVEKYKHLVQHEDEAVDDLWTIDAMAKDANSALDAMNSKSFKWSKDSAYTAEIETMKEMRLFGAYAVDSGNAQNSDKVNMAYGLPDFCNVGIKTDLKNKDDAKYIFFMSMRLLHLPVYARCDVEGVPYEISAVYHFGKSAGIKWFVVIDKEGNVHPTRVKKPIETTPRLKGKGSFKKCFRSNITNYHWVSESNFFGKDLTIEKLAALFINFYQQINANWVVSLSDKRGVMNYSITVAEAKRIFKDRVSATTQTGRKKNIVHWVMAHYRNGISTVKTHIRGNRKFIWKGMNVNISLSGKHGSSLADLKTVKDEYYVENPWWARTKYLQGKYLESKKTEYRNKHKNDKIFTVKNPATGETIEMTDMNSLVA